MVRNIFLTIVFFIFLQIFSDLFAEDTIQLRLQGDLNAAPLFYDSRNELLFTNVAASWFIGVKNNYFSLGAETFADYYSIKSQNEVNSFYGAWFNIRTTISSFIMLNQWLEVKAGAGGIWLRSAFEQNDLGILAQNSIGLTFLLNLKFFLPYSFLDMELKNTGDLLYVNDLNHNFLGVVPAYTGGLRFNFHPGAAWNSIFFEINGFYWNYRSEINSLNSFILKLAVGVAAQVENPRHTSVQSNTEYLFKPAKLPAKLQHPKEIDLNEANLTKIGKAKISEQFTFTNITFVKGSSQLDQNAKDALDKLASILKKYNNLHLSISGYSELMGNPKQELDLSVARADKVKTYLIMQNIDPERLKIIQVGQLSSTKIVFTIIKS